MAIVPGSLRRPETNQSQEQAGQGAEEQWQDGRVRLQREGASPKSESGHHRSEVAGEALQLPADSHIDGHAEQEHQTKSDHGTPQPLIRYAV